MHLKGRNTRNMYNRAETVLRGIYNHSDCSPIYKQQNFNIIKMRIFTAQRHYIFNSYFLAIKTEHVLIF